MDRREPDLRFPHPGEILREEFLLPMGITQYRLGKDLRIPHSRVTAIIRGKRSISPDTALRLGRYFGNSPVFWLGLQSEYDLRMAHEQSGEAIEYEITPLVQA